MNKSEMLTFLDNKFHNCNPEFLKLSQVYFEDEDGDIFCDFIKQLGNSMGADCVHGGCSKSVFHFNEFEDYVFKIPYIGYAYIADEDTQYYKDCAEEERVPSYFCFDDVTLYKNASNDGLYPVDANDYCAAEEYIYRMARKYKVHQMLAKTTFLGFVCGIPVYVSANAGKTYSPKKQSNETSKIAKDMIDKSRKEHKDSYSEFYTTECGVFIETYGRKATQRFIDFLYKEKISDLHNGNYGYDALGNLKIIDYSGFHDLDVF
jgi:hypothetical protein